MEVRRKYCNSSVDLDILGIWSSQELKRKLLREMRDGNYGEYGGFFGLLNLLYID